MNSYTLSDFLNIKASCFSSFSSDNRRICFLDNSSGVMQICTVNADGADIRQHTDYQDSIKSVAYRPGHNQLLFLMDSGGNEHDQIFLLDLKTNETRALTDTPDAIYKFGGFSRDGRFISYSTNRENTRDFYIYLLDLETGKEKCLYQEPGWNMAAGFSGDGSHLSVIKRKTNVSNDLLALDIETGVTRPIASSAGNSSHHSPQWNGENSGIYFISNQNSDFHCLDFYDFNTNETKRLLDAGWDIVQISLSKDNNHIALIINEGGYHRLRVYETSNMQLVSIQCPQDGVNFSPRWANDSKRLTFSSLSPTRTSSAWVLDLETADSWRISPEYQNIPSQELSTPSLVQYESFDGLSVPSFLYLPPQPFKSPLPVVIQIHGGPEGQSGASFMPVVQYLTSNGYAVATPNVRGSAGYGKKYLALDDVEKRMDSVKDIVALRHYLAERPEFDENRIILSGGSYGGYMVLANLAFFPEYWAAGIDIVGISNLVSFLENTSIWRRKLREAEYGSLEHDRDFLETISPLNKADNIQAPLMIIHGANDPRVPLSEAEQIFSSLRKNGREVELLVYNDEGHGLSKRDNRIDAWTKAVAFLDQHVKQT